MIHSTRFCTKENRTRLHDPLRVPLAPQWTLTPFAQSPGQVCDSWIVVVDRCLPGFFH